MNVKNVKIFKHGCMFPLVRKDWVSIDYTLWGPVSASNPGIKDLFFFFPPVCTQYFTEISLSGHFIVSNLVIIVSEPDFVLVSCVEVSTIGLIGLALAGAQN